MATIKDLAPREIFKNFEFLTQVPRPSGHLEKVQAFLLDWAEKTGVQAEKDEAGNIIMRKPATPGMEDRQTVILQAHMDMVPQQVEGRGHDFVNDPISTFVDGDWLKAEGTTLGADDGIGVASIMAILEATDLKHGPLEALITADEETGMFGAFGLKAGELTGSILLNLDTEDEGELTIGCAGGIDIAASLGYKEVETAKDDVAVKVVIRGLLGGHSGLEISCGRANANKLMARLVRAAITDDEARLASWHGGNMRNAIPRECAVVLTVPAENKEDLMDLVAYCKNEFFEEYKDIETADFELYAEECELPSKEVPEEIQDNLVDAILACQNGVCRFIPTIPSVVETSSNLAIINIDGGKAEIQILARSSSESMKEYLATSLESCFSMAGMKVTMSGAYSGWQPDTKSPIVKAMAQSYEELFGTPCKIVVVHAGLECGIIGAVMPGLDMVSFGPTLRSPHTPQERCFIPSVTKYWDLLKKTLEQIPLK